MAGCPLTLDDGQPAPVVAARTVAGPVLAWARGPATPAPGRVLGSGPWGAHLLLGDEVVSVLAAGTPLLPNAVGLGVERLAEPPPAGAPGRLALDRLTAGGLTVALGPPARDWDPRLPPPPADPAARAALAARVADAAPAHALAVARRPAGARALRALRAALRAGDAAAAGVAAAALCGRGPGLTPEGDDLLAGAAATLHAAGRPRLAAALCPPDVAARTSALAATLLRLAARAGAAPEPVSRLLRPETLSAALADLARLGHSTGRAYAAGTGLALGASGSGKRGARVEGDDPGP